VAISSAGQGDLTGPCLVAGPEPGSAFSHAASHAPQTAATPAWHGPAPTPTIARMYDWFLGGENNSIVDREAAAKVLDRYPGARLAARANRAFLRWAVGHLAASRGIRQFLDVGAGLPARPNVHELAQRAIPGARTVYVDHDPAVIARVRAAVAADPRTIALRADVRAPVRLIDRVMASGHLDFGRPIALLLTAVLHFVRDDEHPAEAVRTLLAELAPGSMLVLSHLLGDAQRRDVLAAADQVFQESGTPAVGRTRSQIRRMFEGTHLVEPGLRPVGDWLLITGAVDRIEPRLPYNQMALLDVPVLCGMGRKA